MKTAMLSSLTAAGLVLSLNANAAGETVIDCRNENPHIMARLTVQNGPPAVVAGTIVVGFTHGKIVCPADRAPARDGINCSGLYGRAPRTENFAAKLSFGTTGIAKLQVQLPSVTPGTATVTCLLLNQ